MTAYEKETGREVLTAEEWLKIADECVLMPATWEPLLQPDGSWPDPYVIVPKGRRP